MDSATPPSAVRRMTAWLEVSRVHIGIKEGYRPIVEQILLNCRYLSPHRKKTGGEGLYLVLFPTTFRARVSGIAHGSNIYS